MTAATLSRNGIVSFLPELDRRQPLLARFGLALLALGAVTALLALVDPRTLASGVNVWIKPTKFAVSVGVFALTAAWFHGYVAEPVARGRLLTITAWVLVISGGFEVGYIGIQGARGAESHFNLTSLFYGVMYGLMGVAAVILTATTLPLAWAALRHPAPGVQRSFAAAVAIGLALTFLLGAGFGGYISAQGGAAVGGSGGQVPLVGWNRAGGDLRVAHFFGIHAQQAIPLLGALVAPLAARLRWAAILGGSALYAALTIATFVQAARGVPLLPL